MASAKKALIIGDADDEHTAAIVAAVGARSVEPVLVDAAKLEETPYSLCGGVLMLHGKGGPVRTSLGSATRGWIRRLAPPHWRQGVTSGSEPAAIRGAWISLLTAIAGAPEVTWLTSLERLFLCENKMLQARAAEQLGIASPPTAVVSHRELIPAELGDQLVVKPLGAATYTDALGAEKVVWTQEIRRDSAVLDKLAGAPFVLQSRLQAERHLRVVTIERRSWVCALIASGLPVDWRRQESAHGSFVVADEPAVGHVAVRLAERLGVGYSSQDWIVKDGIPHFVDLNPAGQWLFLPDDVASAVTNSIASWLVR